MSTAPRTSAPAEVHYPDSDGKPLGETPRHVQVILDLFATLAAYFAEDPNVFVAADMFVYYVRGNPRKHVSPDVFLVRSVPKVKTPERRSYRVWEEKKGPTFVLEVTSESTRKEDTGEKFAKYRDELKVREYFLFDPYAEYLQPSLQGYRLWRGRYVPVKPVEGRLPSKVLGLHLERDDLDLRLYDPVGRQRVFMAREIVSQAEAARQQEAAARQQAEAARERAEAEVERLRRELEALRRRLPGNP
jgi:Uma2 family endonuclease